MCGIVGCVTLNGAPEQHDSRVRQMAARIPPDIRLKSNKYVLREAVRPYLPTHALEKTLSGHFSGKQKQEEVIFRLLNLELWYSAFFRS